MSASTRRTFCLVPSWWTIDDYRASPGCHVVGGHGHLNFKELYGPVQQSEIAFEKGSSRIARDFVGRGGLLDLGAVEWLSYPKALRFAYQPAKKTDIKIRGISCRVFEYVEAALRRRESWAQMFVEDMHHQVTKGRIPESTLPPECGGPGSADTLVCAHGETGAQARVPVLHRNAHGA
jgi:hypothetical protein